MRLARLLVDNRAVVARVDAEGLVPILNGGRQFGPGEWLTWTPQQLAERSPIGPVITETEATFLPAVRSPEKIVAIGLNYHDHALESNAEPPSAPLLFTKTNNTLLGHGALIQCPSDLTQQPDYEGELAVVIGKRASRVSQDEAMAHVFGYTIANDVSARDAQFADGQWMRGKNFDTYCPVGPYVTLAAAVPDVMNLDIRTYLNGSLMQDDNTRSMIFGVPALVSYISRYLTLVPGDVILTGTPAGVGFARDPAVYLQDSDVVEVEIENLGRLRNVVSTAPVLASVGGGMEVGAGGVSSDLRQVT